MVSECHSYYCFTSKLLVLILVLVEDGFGEFYYVVYSSCCLCVLILVLVEDGFGECRLTDADGKTGVVLILVLVEDGFGVERKTKKELIEIMS